jgi:hypothetical protein
LKCFWQVIQLVVYLLGCWKWDKILLFAMPHHLIYYWYEDGSIDSPYLPASLPKAQQRTNNSNDDMSLPVAWNKQQRSLVLTIPGHEVVQAFMAILLPELALGSTDPVSPNGGGIYL